MTATLTFSPITIAPGSIGGWFRLPIGGGGYVTGITSHAASGKLANRIDVFGGYVGSSVAGTIWQQLALTTSMPSDYQGTPYLGGGTYDVAFDPTDATGNTIYMYYCPYLGSAPALSTVLKSTNGGASFVRTGFPLTSANANTSSGYGREANKHIAVDPNNANIVYVGDHTNLWVSLNGGTTFSAVSTASVPAPTSAYDICGICFDPTSGTAAYTGAGGSGNGTVRVLVASNGNGVYQGLLTAGSVVWTHITSSPTAVGHGYIGSDGNYYAVTAGAGSVYRISTGNTVTTITAGDGVFALCIDPGNPAHAYGCDVGGYVETFNAALNSGTPTPSTNGTYAVTATDCGWLALIGTTLLSPGDMVWDPLLTSSSSSMTIGTGTFTPTLGLNQNIVAGDMLRFSNTGTPTNYMLMTVNSYTPGTGAFSGTVIGSGLGAYLGGPTGGSGTFSAWTVTKERIWMSTGAAVLYMDGPKSSGSNTWHSQTSGIENMVGYNSVKVAGNVLAISTEDVGQVFPYPNQPLLQTGIHGRGPLSEMNTTVEGGRIDISASDNTYWVCSTSIIITGSGPIFSGYSTQSGAIGTITNGDVTSWQSWASAPGVHGYIKCSTDLNTVVAGYAGAIKFTTNGGASWASPSSGAPATVPGNWNSTGADCLAKDWVTANKFYVTDGGHVYSSTDGGNTWTTGAAVTSTSYLLQLRSVPGQAGHLFFTAGARQDGQSASSFAALKSYHPVATSNLYFSHDSGATFTVVANTAEAISVGFSAPQPGGNGYPAVAFIGWLSGTYGVWRCDNFNTAMTGLIWTSMGLPLWIDVPTSIDGDAGQWGRFFVSFNGSSFELVQVAGQPNGWP